MSGFLKSFQCLIYKWLAADLYVLYIAFYKHYVKTVPDRSLFPVA